MDKRTQIKAWIKWILQEREWSMDRLARRADVAASTINRFMRLEAGPLLSSRTIEKIEAASGTAFAPHPVTIAEVFSEALKTASDEEFGEMLTSLQQALRERPEAFLRSWVERNPEGGQTSKPESVTIRDDGGNVLYIGPERRNRRRGSPNADTPAVE